MTQVPGQSWQDIAPQNEAADIPEGLWMCCPVCEVMVYRKNIETNLWVCTECQHHHRVSATQRVEQLCDPDSFEPRWTNVHPADPLKFVDLKPYKDRLKSEQEKTKTSDAIKGGARTTSRAGAFVLACLGFEFMGGSMGSVVGEKIHARDRARARAQRMPLVSSPPRAARACRRACCR